MGASVEAIALHLRPVHGFVARTFALLRRYWAWELTWLVYSAALVTTTGFLAVGMGTVAGTELPTDKILIYLLTGSLLWRYLSELFSETSNVISWERWEGTIESTFMAPISRVTHLLGMSMFSVLYAGGRLVLLSLWCALMFDLDLSNANLFAACAVLGLSTFSLLGLGLMGASLPLIYPEKGSQMAGIIEAGLLVVSGVYYPVEVLPGWLRVMSTVSPITYTLRGMRAAMLEGASLGDLHAELIPLVITAIVLIPLGMKVFSLAEVHCKRTGKLKRSG